MPCSAPYTTIPLKGPYNNFDSGRGGSGRSSSSNSSRRSGSYSNSRSKRPDAYNCTYTVNCSYAVASVAAVGVSRQSSTDDLREYLPALLAP